MENLFTPNCIRTFSGQYVNVFETNPDTINITDIAHALSHQCRFGGHLPKFYSVAQHCVLCYEVAKNDKDRFAALMHDASEAYLLDIPRPIKHGLGNYSEIEDRLMKVIAKKFSFEYPMNAAVKAIDDSLLLIEWDELMLLSKVAQPVIERCWSSGEAEAKFLHIFDSCKSL